ncbi:MAG: hypothetical protein SGILL_000621 [Bacillariaceae sp.]
MVIAISFLILHLQASSEKNNNNEDDRNPNRGYNHRGEKQLLAEISPRTDASDDDDDDSTADNGDGATFRQGRANRERQRRNDDDSLSSPPSIARPGAHRVPGINGAADSSRTLSSVTTMSTESTQPNPQTQQEQQQNDVTLVATPLEAVNERDLAEQYCQDRLREIEEREQRLREQEVAMAGGTATVVVSVSPDDATLMTSDAASIITATVVSAADTITPVPPAAPQAGKSKDKTATKAAAGKATTANAPSDENKKDQSKPQPPESKHRRKPSSGGGVFAKVAGAFRRGDSSKDIVGSSTTSNKSPVGGIARASSISSSVSSSTISSKPNPAATATIVSNFSAPAMNGWTWCWQETPARISLHDPALIVGDVKDCWIRYHFAVNRSLEIAFKAQDQKGTCDLPDPLSGYHVNFDTMQQTELSNGYQRQIKREFLVPPKDNVDDNKKKKTAASKKVDKGDDAPPVPGNRNSSAVWSWRETPSQMERHDPSEVESESRHLIRYSPESAAILEQAYQSKQKECRPIPGYRVDLTIAGREEVSSAGKNGSVQTTVLRSFVQTKDATGYKRDVIRRSVKND